VFINVVSLGVCVVSGCAAHNTHPQKLRNNNLALPPEAILSEASLINDIIRIIFVLIIRVKLVYHICASSEKSILASIVVNHRLRKK